MTRANLKIEKNEIPARFKLTRQFLTTDLSEIKHAEISVHRKSFVLLLAALVSSCSVLEPALVSQQFSNKHFSVFLSFVLTLLNQHIHFNESTEQKSSDKVSISSLQQINI